MCYCMHCERVLPFFLPFLPFFFVLQLFFSSFFFFMSGNNSKSRKGTTASRGDSDYDLNSRDIEWFIKYKSKLGNYKNLMKVLYLFISLVSILFTIHFIVSYITKDFNKCWSKFGIFFSSLFFCIYCSWHNT